jgi:hypothetical protein
MILKFSPDQARMLGSIMDPVIWIYLQCRYGVHWQWYWLNWEQNQELLF